MAKRRRPSDKAKPERAEIEVNDDGGSEAAVAVEAPPAPPAPPAAEKPQPPQKADQPAGNLGEDVASLDAETNAKYEQVKGGKLYIKDLQQMDVQALHEIAKHENIQDFVGLKKQDLIFQILRSRIRQNGLM